MQAILSFPVQYVSTGLHRLGYCVWWLLSLLGLKAPVTLVVWESLRLRNLVQSCPLSLRHICMKHPADEYCGTDLSEGCLDAFFFGSLLLGSSPGRSALQSAE